VSIIAFHTGQIFPLERSLVNYNHRDSWREREKKKKSLQNHYPIVKDYAKLVVHRITSGVWGGVGDAWKTQRRNEDTSVRVRR